MKKSFLLLYLFLIVPTAWAEQMDHNASKECAVCHYEWMPEFVYELKGTDIVDYQGEKVVATEKICFSCHNGTVADSRVRIWSGDMHQIKDKIPENMQVPDNLPLDDGKVNCRTCHSAHATGDPKTEGVAGGVFLRMENSDSQLCRACHTDLDKKGHPSHPLTKPEKNAAAIEKKLAALGAKTGGQGQIICQSCHTPHSPRDKALLIYPVDDSRLCSICHTDKVNPKNAMYIKGMLNHPIDIRQDNPEIVAKVKKAGGVYGKRDEVICLTCHTTHKGKTDSLLIEKNVFSELCIICHENKRTVFAGKHNMRKVAGFRTKDGKTADEKGACQSCHAPHGWSLEPPATGEDMADMDMVSTGCLSCHQEGGYAQKKALCAKRFNHPVGVRLKDNMAAGELPLFSYSFRSSEGHISERQSGDMVTCATCHDVHAGGGNFLRTEAGDGRLCITCHSGMQMIEKTGHGRQKLSRSCLSCHKVHNSETSRLLNLGENDGCLECHRKGGSAEKFPVDPACSHPVNMIVKNKVKAPFETTPEGLFTCVTCHDPHKPGKTGNMQKDFLRGEYSGRDDFCIACHETQKEIIGSDHDNRKNDTDPVCGQCHSVHNAKTAGNIMAVAYPYKDRNDSCKACHNETGTAKEKIITSGHKLGKIDNAVKYRKYITRHDSDGFIYCSSCHTVHNNGPAKGAEGTTRDSFLDRNLYKNGNFCLGCHEDRVDFAASKHNVNAFESPTEKSAAPIAEGNTCGACHKVHNSGYYLFDNCLGKDYEKICTSCHTKKGLASQTAISTSHRLNIQLKNSRDVYQQDGKLVCVTCHEPHAKNKGMLRHLDKQNLCIVCHENQKTVELSGHNLARAEYLESDAGKNAQGNVCAACHKPHNFHKDNRLMWAFDSDRRGLFNKKSAFAFGVCTDCHVKDGIGRKKVPEVLAHDNIFKILPAKVKEMFKQYLYDESGVPSKDGFISCQSCHDPHVLNKALTASIAGVDADKSNGFLKENVRETFCAKCHGIEHSKEVFGKFHDRSLRESRKKKRSDAQVLRNLMIIQINLKKLENN